MTREEQFKAGAQNFVESAPNISFDASLYEGFIAGCNFADANRWVKVEDGLPEIGKRVAVITKDCKVIRMDQRAVYGLHGVSFVYRDVTHWQYITLPEPPKAEQ